MLKKIVKAYNEAANQLDARPSITTDIADSTIPNSVAEFAGRFPDGTGLELVRDIKLSV